MIHYIIEAIQTLSIAFLYFKLYRKPKLAINNDNIKVFKRSLPIEFKAELSPAPIEAVPAKPEVIPQRRSSYNEPRR